MTAYKDTTAKVRISRMATINSGLPESGDSLLNTNLQPAQETGISELFAEFTHKLRSKFNINKGVLVLRRRPGEALSAISTWNQGETLDGLSIKLPEQPSLFERVVEGGQTYWENITDLFTGNFFEKKLLIDESSQSFVLQPLRYDGEVIGLVGYSANDSTDFSRFEEDEVQRTTNEFAEYIGNRIGEF